MKIWPIYDEADNYLESAIQQKHLLLLILSNNSLRIIFMHINHDYTYESCSLSMKLLDYISDFVLI